METQAQLSNELPPTWNEAIRRVGVFDAQRGEPGSAGACRTTVTGSDCASVGSRKSRTKQERAEAHKRRVARERQIIDFMRTFEDPEDFSEIVAWGKHEGLFGRTTNDGDIELHLSRTWRHRNYWESPAVLTRHEGGSAV